MNLTDLMAVTVPEGTSGDVRVERFTVTEAQSRLDAVLNMGSGRYCRPGTYTRLMRGRRLWMSDTVDERRDHLEAVCEVRDRRAETVLVNGLGLGMVVAALVHIESVQRIDVCEIDTDVIALVGQHVTGLGRDHGVEVVVRQGDARQPDDVWGRGTRWDGAWHDIWPDIDAGSWDERKAVRRRYCRRVGWQGMWADREIRREIRRERAYAS